MRGKKADRTTIHALSLASGVFVCVIWTTAGFAQEPPLTVPLAGVLPPSSTGCNIGIAGPGGYAGLHGGLDAGIGAAANSGTIAGATANGGPLNPGNNYFGTNFSLSDVNGSYPLYSTPTRNSNFPLYSTPTPGANAALYSNASLANLNLGNYGGGGNNLPPTANIPQLRCRSGIPAGEWLLYPSLRTSSLYSDNLFLTPTAPMSAVGLGLTPSLTAEWTNGIHTTTIYGAVDAQYYPTDTSINTFDRQVAFTQKYSPLPDLIFTGVADYTHHTISSALTNSIQPGASAPQATPILLQTGNIQLPNGNVISPTGQVLGNVNQALASSGVLLVNPYDVYTATAEVSKIFNGGFLSLSGSFADTSYQLPQGVGTAAFTSYKTDTFSENGSVALGPLLYAYSTGDFTSRNQNSLVNSTSQAYIVKGGLGFRPIGLFRGSAYFGYQASEVQGSGSAGGSVFGGKVSYNPTYAWAIIAGFDETINLSSQSAISNQALTLPANSPVQVPLSSSTRIATPSLQSVYQLSPQWTVLGNLSYSQIDYIGTPTLTNAWLADVKVSYEIRRNMTLTGEYQFADILSSAVGDSAHRSLIMLSAEYRF